MPTLHISASAYGTLTIPCARAYSTTILHICISVGTMHVYSVCAKRNIAYTTQYVTFLLSPLCRVRRRDERRREYIFPFRSYTQFFSSSLLSCGIIANALNANSMYRAIPTAVHSRRWGEYIRARLILEFLLLLLRSVHFCCSVTVARVLVCTRYTHFLFV